MPPGKRQKKLLLALGLLVTGLLLIWLALPVWFPWVLRPLARAQGADYSQYQRDGYSRFILSGLSYSNRTTTFRAERVEALVPSAWLWRLAFGNQSAPFSRVVGWNYHHVPSHRPPPSPAQNVRDAGVLKRWLPLAIFENGAIQLPHQVIRVNKLTWNQGHVSVELALADPPYRAVLRSADLSSPPCQVQVESDSLHVAAGLQVTTNRSGYEIDGAGYCFSNRFDLQAQLGLSGVPLTGSLVTTNFHLPAAILRLPEYGDVHGSVSAGWRDGGFIVDVTAAAQPVSTETNLPPVELALHAYGNTNSAVIQNATLASPWVTARLSRELKLSFSGPLLSQPARLALRADLSRQPWLPLRGSVRGDAFFTPSEGRFPNAQFTLTGTNVGNQAVQTREIELEGRLTWPRLQLDSARIDFIDGSKASVNGALDLASKVASDGKFQFTGPLAERWLPPGYSYRGLTVSGEFAGSLNHFTHKGRLQVDGLRVPNLTPLEFRAEYEGEDKAINNAELLAVSGMSSVHVACSAILRSNEAVQVQLRDIALSKTNDTVLQLARPTEISLARTQANDSVSIGISPLELSGSGGQIHARGTLDWPGLGDLALSMRHVSSTLLDGFVETPLLPVEIQSLHASVNWSNSPARYELELAGRMDTFQKIADQIGDALEPIPTEPEKQTAGAETNSAATLTKQVLSSPVTAELKLAGDERGLVVSNLVLFSHTSEVAVVTGFIPVTLRPSRVKLLSLDEHRPLQAVATVKPEGFVWGLFSRWTGVRLKRPELSLNVSGTWLAPQGRVQLSALSLAFPKVKRSMPALDNVQLTLELERDQARLSECRVFVQGQPVVLTGALPLGESFWSGLAKRQPPNWDAVSARLQIPDAELAAFEPLAPDILAPQGRIHADIALLPGGELDGSLVLRRGRTRPLSSVGPVRDVELDLRFQGRTLRLEKAAANVSGAPVELTGKVNLLGTQWLKGEMPEFEFLARGTDIPLARQPEYIVRSDLLLSLTKTNGAPPLISGEAHLRDSYYLSELGALVPGKVASPTRRPPYFSLEQPSLADWRLAVNVEGERFMKVRSPLFNGEVSANLKLQGTLKDPIALGDVKIDSGTVSFPFASLEVKQGLVSLSSQDPYHPQLSVTATSKQFGYDIRMSVTGPVDAPVIQFNSTPPLSSEQILLMVSAGEMPSGTFTLSTQQRAQTMALFLGRDLLSKLGVGDQAQQRLTIQSGEDISEQGRPTYRAEYKLNDNWSILGERDRFGDFNADFKWRFYSR